MPGEGLTPEQVRELVKGFGSLEAAAAEAERRPGYAKDLRAVKVHMTFASLGKSDTQLGDLHESYWRLVYAAAGEASAADQPTRGFAPFPRAAFNTAVRLLREGEGVAEVARRTDLSRNRVMRIRDRYVSPRPDCPEYEAVPGPIFNTVILRRRF